MRVGRFVPLKFYKVGIIRSIYWEALVEDLQLCIVGVTLAVALEFNRSNRL